MTHGSNKSIVNEQIKMIYSKPIGIDLLHVSVKLSKRSFNDIGDINLT